MTTEEAKKLYDKLKEKNEKEFAKAMWLYNERLRGEDINNEAFPRWTMTEVNDYLDLYDMTVDELMTKIPRWVTQCRDNHGKKPYFRIGLLDWNSLEITAFGEGDWVCDGINLVATWKEPIGVRDPENSDKYIEKKTDEDFKKELAKLIWPEKAPMNINFWSGNIDCKLLSLFMDGKIDWDTFAELQKAGCS